MIDMNGDQRDCDCSFYSTPGLWAISFMWHRKGAISEQRVEVAYYGANRENEDGPSQNHIKWFMN